MNEIALEYVFLILIIVPPLYLIFSIKFIKNNIILYIIPVFYILLYIINNSIFSTYDDGKKVDFFYLMLSAMLLSLFSKFVSSKLLYKIVLAISIFLNVILLFIFFTLIPLLWSMRN